MADELRHIRDFREASPAVPGDAGVALLAGRQCGMVSVRQLRAAELSRDAVRRRVEKGLLIDQGRGVYALGYERRDDEARAWRAVLMYERTALSRTSAAWAHGLRASLGRVHLSSLTSRRSTTAAQVHVVRALDIEVIRGLPCTTLARTFLDCASVLNREELVAMVRRAEELRTFDLHPILAFLSDNRGSPALRDALAAHRAAAEAPTRSELERRFRTLILNASVPEPLWNVFVEGLWVDAYWPAQRVVVELDGGTHRTVSAQDKDTRRTAILTAAGYVPLRFTWGQVTTDRPHVLRTLRALL